jgi:hypothetical protein
LSKRVSHIKGNQGVWNAKVEYDDGSVEILACVHDRCWVSGNHYHDAWDGPRAKIARKTKKFRDHVELMRTRKRVIVTSNETHGIRAQTRVGYRGVFNIDNFTFSEADGVSFDFVGGIPKTKTSR